MGLICTYFNRMSPSLIPSAKPPFSPVTFEETGVIINLYLCMPQVQFMIDGFSSATLHWENWWLRFLQFSLGWGWKLEMRWLIPHSMILWGIMHCNVQLHTYQNWKAVANRGLGEEKIYNDTTLLYKYIFRFWEISTCLEIKNFFFFFLWFITTVIFE